MKHEWEIVCKWIYGTSIVCGPGFCRKEYLAHIFVVVGNVSDFNCVIYCIRSEKCKKFKKVSLWNFWLPWKFIMEIFHIPNINKIGKVHQKRISKIYFILHEKFLFLKKFNLRNFLSSYMYRNNFLWRQLVRRFSAYKATERKKINVMRREKVKYVSMLNNLTNWFTERIQECSK